MKINLRRKVKVEKKTDYNIPVNYNPKSYSVSSPTLDKHLEAIDNILQVIILGDINVNSFVGPYEKFTTNEDFLFGDIGFIDINGKISMSSAVSEETGLCDVICLNDTVKDSEGLFGLSNCIIKNNTWNLNNGIVYLSLNNGKFTNDDSNLNSGNINLPIGRIINNNTLLFNPSDTPITLK